MPTRHLYLIRHGQYNQVYEPDELGGSLTQLGRDQASYVAEALRTIHAQGLYVSPLRRAQETAQFIANRISLNPHIVPELREVVPVIPPEDKAIFKARLPDYDDARLSGDRRQADSAFDRFFVPASEDEDHLVLVCHGNLIRYLVCRAIDIPVVRWTRLETNHCGITRCAIDDDGRIRLVSMNDVGHLPLDLRWFT